MFNGKKVLITGATGMIGRELVELLKAERASITAVSLDNAPSDPLFEDVNFVRLDLRSFDSCKKIAVGQEYVFHLAGIKGSPQMTQKNPATFFTNTMMFNLNVMEASRLSGVKGFLYTSSVGVYSPANIFYEDDVWRTSPSPNDKFAGYAKRMGELQAEALSIEYGWNVVSIIRPANVYGSWDNFDPNTAMVIPSLIARIVADENPLAVWGDGSAIRDFVHARDVARAMLFAVQNEIRVPINIGSGFGISIKEITEIFKKIIPKLEIKWNPDKPKGDDSRVMDMTRLNSAGFKNIVSLENGINETLNWYRGNMDKSSLRYNAFNEGR